MISFKDQLLTIYILSILVVVIMGPFGLAASLLALILFFGIKLSNPKLEKSQSEFYKYKMKQSKSVRYESTISRGATPINKKIGNNKIDPCCTQTARLQERFCPCGKAITESLWNIYN